MNAAHHSTTHGMNDTLTYRGWAAMKQRCNNPNNNGYENYGGRGITITPNWLSFEGFFADMGIKPDGHTLDRIDNDGDYEPGNCRWATRTQQNRNMGMLRNNRSGVKGVRWHKRHKRWAAWIGVANKQIHLGNHATLEDAAAARKQGEIDHWGGPHE
jgi:hypothetical protein